jgi:tetratricopeptide (TPR) repeat protein
LAVINQEFDRAVDRLARLADEQGSQASPQVYWALMEAYLGSDQLDLALESALDFVRCDFSESPWVWQPEQSSHLASLLGGLRKEISAEDPWEADESERWQAILVLLKALGEMELELGLQEEIDAEVLLIEVEQAARRRFGGINVALNPAQKIQIKAIQQAVEVGDLTRAIAQIDQLVAAAPRSADAWGVRGELYQNRPDRVFWAEAEKSYRRAHHLAPNNPEWGVALVHLLTQGYGGRRDAEAIPVLRELLGHKATRTLQLQLAQLLAKTGDYAGARLAYLAFLEQWPNAESVPTVREFLGALQRELPTELDLVIALPRAQDSLRQGAQWQYHLSVVYQARSMPEKAIAHAVAALGLQPDWPLVLNHLADLLEDRDTATALIYLEQSLILDPAQQRVRVQRVLALFKLGKPTVAEIALRELAEDAPEFHFRLARLEADRQQLEAAQTQLDLFFQRYSGERFQEEAEELQARLAPELDPRFWLPFLFGTGLVGTLGFGIFRRRRKRKGISLRAFLQKEPRCYHDVARVLAGMRHEVLKHNTTLLPSVAEALEKGDRGPALDASGILIGGQGAEGVIALWDRYVSELEAIGQANGQRINLRYTDPEIAPMCQAFRNLQQLAPQLHKAKPQSLVPQIRSISHALNTVGYAQLGKLLHELCVLEIDRAVLDAAWQRVAREPGLVGRGLGPPIIDLACQVQVRVFREDLVDILANLLRNACDAVLAGCEPNNRRIGFRITEDMDPITGFSWVAIRVLDNAPGTLTDAMLKGRGIGRGVGLAMDLAKRSQGSLKVEEEPGWSKAVVLRLAVAEDFEA